MPDEAGSERAVEGNQETGARAVIGALACVWTRTNAGLSSSCDAPATLLQVLFCPRRKNCAGYPKGALEFTVEV